MQRVPIDPFAFTHRCDNAATYVPKQKPKPTQQWQKVTDTTGRGFGEAQKKVPGDVSNFKTKQHMPNPSMNDICTQAHNSLDTGNRFFVDNKKALDKFDHGKDAHKLQERGTLSSGQKVRTFCATDYPRPASKPASRVK